jgi:hypothetical protein
MCTYAAQATAIKREGLDSTVEVTGRLYLYDSHVMIRDCAALCKAM